MAKRSLSRILHRAATWMGLCLATVMLECLETLASCTAIQKRKLRHTCKRSSHPQNVENAADTQVRLQATQTHQLCNKRYPLYFFAFIPRCVLILKRAEKLRKGGYSAFRLPYELLPSVLFLACVQRFASVLFVISGPTP